MTLFLLNMDRLTSLPWPHALAQSNLAFKIHSNSDTKIKTTIFTIF